MTHGAFDPMTPWSMEPKDRVGDAVVGLAKKWYEDQSGRRTAAQQGLRAYYAREFPTLSSGYLMQTTPRENDFILTPARSICDTAVAKIASKQRPRAIVQTKGGTYSQRLQAKKVSKWLLAVLYQRQGQWANTWELTEQCERDCTRWEAGVVKVVGDRQKGAILHERCYPYDLLFDEYEAEHGLKNLVHVYRYDRWNLVEMFPEHAEQIRAAAMFPELGSTNPLRNFDMIAVYEAWRLPFGPKKPGRHVIAIDGPGGPALVDEEWKHEEFPFAILRWTPQPYGIMGDPLIQQLIGLQDCLNELANDLHENVRLQSGGHIAYNPNEVDAKLLETNLPFKLIPVNGNVSASFAVSTPAPFHPSSMQFVEFLRNAHYEYTGVSEMSAMSRKEPGVDAAVAMRTMNDLQSERFLPQARAYEQLFVTLGRLDLMIASDMEKDGVQVKATFPSDGGVDEIDFTKVKLPEESYVVTLQAASSTEDTLAGRRQIVAEMVQRGTLTPEEADELLSSSSVDVEALSKRDQAQRRYLEGLIAKFQEYEEPESGEDEELGEDDLDDEEDDDDAPPGVYVAPDPVLDLPRGIIQMSEGLIEMLADGAPEVNQNLLRQWIDDADALVARAQQAPAPEAGPMGPGGGMPANAPPGMPMAPMGMAPPVAA